jgi:peroxiredoxin
MTTVGQPLPEAVSALPLASATDPSPRTLRELFRGRPLLVVFVRQFACAGCSERMTELLTQLEILESSGVDCVVVGSGTVEQARDLRSRLSLETRSIHLLTDSTLAIHRALGLRRSPWGVLGAKGTWNLVRAIARGHKNAWGHGDFYQLGGTLLLDASGTVVLLHREAHLGETLPIADVVDRALALAIERGGIAHAPGVAV